MQSSSIQVEDLRYLVINLTQLDEWSSEEEEMPGIEKGYEGCHNDDTGDSLQ